jgi:N4-gp56 family major capsid protein
VADFALSTASAKEEWAKKFYLEYVRQNALLKFMGSDETAIIRVREELSNTAGAAIHFPLITRLRGAGVTGGTVLYGSEDTMGNYSDCIRTAVNRNAVMVTEDQSFKTEIDLFNAARATLKNWAAEKLRDDLIAQLQSIIVKNGAGNGAEDISVLYASATEAQKDAFLDNNIDRILFGGAKSNVSQSAPAGGATNDHSASLLNVNNSTGKLSAATLRVAKTMAKKAGSLSGHSHVAPYVSDMTSGREYFVLLVGSEGFRDLSLDTTVINMNQYARAREGSGMDKNPLFQDGDLLVNGIIVREVPEMPVIAGAGASGIDVGTALLCGQSALAVGWSKRPNPRKQEFDYGHRLGAGISEIRGQKKVSFNGVQYGCVTLYHSAVGDS